MDATSAVYNLDAEPASQDANAMMLKSQHNVELVPRVEPGETSGVTLILEDVLTGFLYLHEYEMTRV